MSIVTGLKGWISWSWIFLWENVRTPSNRGRYWEIPTWRLRDFPRRAKPEEIWRDEGNLTLVEHVYIISSLSGKHGFKQNIHCNPRYGYIFLYSPATVVISEESIFHHVLPPDLVWKNTSWYSHSPSRGKYFLWGWYIVIQILSGESIWHTYSNGEYFRNSRKCMHFILKK